MPLDRPPRPPAGALTDAVRSAILAEAHRRGLQAPDVLAFHAEADYHADVRHVLADVERRYALPAGSFAWNTARHRFFTITLEPPPNFWAIVEQKIFSDEGAGPILLELPETEFLTVIENTLKIALRNGRLQAQAVADLYEYVGGALRAHGTPYRAAGGDWGFEWVGDPTQHELTVQPALLALADPRVAGARAEFEEALDKRRGGTPKDLEDAVDEAAKAIESVLQVLIAELGVTPPRRKQLTPLFESLVGAKKIPGYVDKLVAAASGPRNHMASHGQGGAVREVPEELADASIAAAATAITFLAHYLP